MVIIQNSALGADKIR